MLDSKSDSDIVCCLDQERAVPLQRSSPPNPNIDPREPSYHPNLLVQTHIAHSADTIIGCLLDCNLKFVII